MHLLGLRWSIVKLSIVFSIHSSVRGQAACLAGLTLMHLLGTFNSAADLLSRQTHSPGEWRWTPEVGDLAVVEREPRGPSRKALYTRTILDVLRFI